MWQTVALASAGGGVAACFAWQALEFANRRAARDRLARRLRDTGRPSAPAAHPIAITTQGARYSYLPILRGLLRRLAIAPRLYQFLEQAGSTLNVSSYIMLHLCSVLVGVLVAYWLETPAVVSAGLVLVAGAVPWIVMATKRRNRLLRLSEQLSDAIRLIVSALRAGLGLDAGLHLVTSELPDPIRGEFRKLLNESLLEGDMSKAFRRMALRLPNIDFRLFAASACLHRDIGGNFTELLDQLEHTVRARFELHRELKTLTAESRLTGWILGSLPVVVAVGIVSLRPAYLRPLLVNEFGQAMLSTAIILQLIGFGIIWWLIRPRVQ